MLQFTFLVAGLTVLAYPARSLCALPDSPRSNAFTVGFGLGFVVALQLGPISLYLIRSTLRGGSAVGSRLRPRSR
jgi:hypothetical protein